MEQYLDMQIHAYKKWVKNWVQKMKARKLACKHVGAFDGQHFQCVLCDTVLKVVVEEDVF